MSDALSSEIIHLTCQNCHQITSLGLGTLIEKIPNCPFCGVPFHVDLQKAREDALRKAEELDHSVDALGSME
jgi:hypothetical protein